MAAFIPEEKIAEIRNAADIHEIVSDVVMLKKTGKNHQGLCPFHSEKTPSFTVSPSKQIFHCFGCQESGDVFRFLMKHDGLSFPEAVRTVARRYAIDLPEDRTSVREKREISLREQLLHLNRQTMAYYQEMLQGDGGRIARDYLDRRRMHPDTIDLFGLGFAPDGWDNLVRFLKRKKLSRRAVTQSGLVKPGKADGYYDAFRNRIMFPIFDVRGMVIGFGGRVMDESLPKYLNSPETPVYSKNKSLYGLFQAKRKCRETGVVFVVEGYFDMLSLYNAGVENTVATLGTALTPGHVRMLKGFADNIVLVYDSDDAGIKAAHRSIRVFEEHFVDARIMVLPKGYDPDDYIREFGSEAFLRQSENAMGVMAFLIESAIRRHGLTIEGKLNIIRSLESAAAGVSDPVARSLFIQRLSERIDVEEAAILEKIRGRIRPAGAPLSSGSGMTAEHRNQVVGTRRERKLLAMMIQYPTMIAAVEDHRVLNFFEDETLRALGRRILEYGPVEETSMAAFIEGLQTPALIRLATELSLAEEHWNDQDCMKLIRQFVSVGHGRGDQELLNKIKEAERSGNRKLLNELLDRKQKMAVVTEQRKRNHEAPDGAPLRRLNAPVSSSRFPARTEKHPER